MPGVEDLGAAVARAIAFCSSSREAQALVWLEHMHRRFGIPAFAGSLRRFDRLLAEQPQEAPKLRLFRRIADPGSTLRFEDLQSVSHPSDGIIVSALYCDRLELPPSFGDLLSDAVRAGGYYCTHALLAWVWLQEYGGGVGVPAGFVEDLLRANAAIVNDDTSVVTDLKLEAAAFLCLAGEGARVDAAFVATVLKRQNDDGGWGMTRKQPGISDWHGTVLGLMLLLHVREAQNA
ncbi:MAG TPA: hypothetical protein VMR74_03285 [Gammaproteobacteria bacterium]|nr:hypothetical protein [Gammaproteobacteria bacterium]